MPVLNTRQYIAVHQTDANSNHRSSNLPSNTNVKHFQHICIITGYYNALCQINKTMNCNVLNESAIMDYRPSLICDVANCIQMYLVTLGEEKVNQAIVLFIPTCYDCCVPFIVCIYKQLQQHSVKSVRTRTLTACITLLHGKRTAW